MYAQSANADRDEELQPMIPSVSINFCGFCRQIPSLGWKERIFGIVSAFSLLVAIIFTIIRMTELNSSSAQFTFGVVILLSAVFCFLYVVLAVFYQRTLELIVIIVAFTTTAVIVIIYFATTTNRNIYQWVRFIAVVVCWVLVVPYCCYMIFRDIKDYPNFFFNGGVTIGQQQTTLYIENMFRSVLLMDVQVSLTMVALLWPEGIHFDKYDRYLIFPTAFAGIGVCVAGHFYAHKKTTIIKCVKTTLCVVYSVCWLVMLAYAIWLIYKSSKDMSLSKGTAKAVDGIYIVALSASTLSLLLRAVTIILGTLLLYRSEKENNSTYRRLFT